MYIGDRKIEFFRHRNTLYIIDPYAGEDGVTYFTIDDVPLSDGIPQLPAANKDFEHLGLPGSFEVQEDNLHYLISEPEPEWFASKKFLITLTLGMSALILLLVYFLYTAYQKNQRLQIELDSINEKIITTSEDQSEDSDFYKQINKNESITERN